MKQLKDLCGEKFGLLTPIEKVRLEDGSSRWKCICECGKTTFVRAQNLTNGSTKSCGCNRYISIGEKLKKPIQYEIKGDTAICKTASGVEFDIEDKKLFHSCGGIGKANKCYWVPNADLKPFVGTKHPRVRRVVIEITDNGANAKYCVGRHVENAVSVHRYKEDAPDDGKAAVYAVAKLFGVDLNEMGKDEKAFSEMRDAWRKFKSVIEDKIFDNYGEE